MNRYSTSIETNTDSITGASFATKKDAIAHARGKRNGGSYRFTKTENPHSTVYDNVKQVAVYCKPIFNKNLHK